MARRGSGTARSASSAAAATGATISASSIAPAAPGRSTGSASSSSIVAPTGRWRWPSPLMPHLALSWLERRARTRFGADVVARLPLTAPPPTPWQRAGTDGTHYASYATWTCPVNCIEPVRCPATRGHRAWSMPDAMRFYVDSLPEGARLLGPLVFHCSHRAYGVGMIDVDAIVAADAFVAAHAARGRAEFLLATVSHCHGAMGRLAVGR